MIKQNMPKYSTIHTFVNTNQLLTLFKRALEIVQKYDEIADTKHEIVNT